MTLSDLFKGILGISAAFSFSSCAVVESNRSCAASGSELLREARAMTWEKGLPAARDFVADRLKLEDSSAGELERRVIRTTRDSNLFFPDSLAALPATKRAKIALIIIPGMSIGFGGSSKTRETLWRAGKEAESMGFDTHFIDTPIRGDVVENARMVAEQVESVFDDADHVMILALSKGAHDIIDYLQEDALEFSASRRSKVNVVISLVGTLQGSVVADYFARANRPGPVIIRAGLRIQGKSDELRMLKTVAQTPWNDEDAKRMRSGFPNLTWISLTMIPDGEDGRITEKLWSPFIRKRITTFSPYFSPCDGLVESAASVLPDEVEVPEWIVRGFGSHCLPNGHYIDGSRIAPKTTDPGDEELRPVSGGEVMSAYLRALPNSLL